jgi:hypothetical protein
LNLAVCFADDLTDGVGVDSRTFAEVLVNLPAGIQCQELKSCVREEKGNALIRAMERVWLLANLLEKGGKRFEPQAVVQFISYQEAVAISYAVFGLPTFIGFPTNVRLIDWRQLF